MAQSSNYKQYTRATRVLTEESGFAGGMLWTGNNIDETHLKAIVNCDYDDTTGYLKTRNPFVPTVDSPFKEQLETIDVNLNGYSLLGTYNICSFDKSDAVLDAGRLYIFTDSQNSGGVKRCRMDTIVCVYYVNAKYYKCNLALTAGVELYNIIPSNILLNYDNQLYGLGQSPLNIL